MSVGLLVKVKVFGYCLNKCGCTWCLCLCVYERETDRNRARRYMPVSGPSPVFFSSPLCWSELSFVLFSQLREKKLRRCQWSLTVLWHHLSCRTPSHKSHSKQICKINKWIFLQRAIVSLLRLIYSGGGQTLWEAAAYMTIAGAPGATRGWSVLFIINGMVKVSSRWLVLLGIKQTRQAYEKEVVCKFGLSLVSSEIVLVFF